MVPNRFTPAALCINRNIVECKVSFDAVPVAAANCINRNIVECKAGSNHNEITTY